MDITIWIAFLAGLLSILSPCVLSLIPIYLTYLSGMAITSDQSISTPRLRINLFLHGLGFVIGFSTLFILLGLAASAFGNLLYNGKDIISKIGGILIVLFGFHLSGILTIPILNYEFRLQSDKPRNKGFATSFLMGLFFSAGWSPCIGPTLGAILVIAANRASLDYGFWLLLAYSIGMAIPFLLSTVLVEFLLGLIKKFKRMAVLLSKGFGILLILIGWMLFLGVFDRFAQFSALMDFGL